MISANPNKVDGEAVRIQFINCANDYTERAPILDMIKAFTYGRLDLRKKLKARLNSIYMSMDKVEDIEEELDQFYDKLGDAFYEYADTFSIEDSKSLTASLDGARFKPPIHDIAVKIWEANHGTKSKGKV